jgi:uncharacterized protein YvpB
MRSKYIKIGIAIFICVGVAFGFYIQGHGQPQKIDIAKEFPEIAGQKKQSVYNLPKVKDQPEEQATKQSNSIPEKAYLNVPFSPQAPFGNWDQPYQDACEEASIIMVHYFLQGKTLSRDQMNTEILKMVAWQEKNWGGHHDLEATQIVSLAKSFYGYKNIKLKYGFTIDDIKKEIAAGHPVIIPSAGRLLGNPNFRGAGPLYHCLVIKGYTRDWIITNDPGTRNGFDYVYLYETILKAAHEWNGGNVTQGRSAMIVIYG